MDRSETKVNQSKSQVLTITTTDAIRIPIERGMASSDAAVVDLTVAIAHTIHPEAVVVAPTEAGMSTTQI